MLQERGNGLKGLAAVGSTTRGEPALRSSKGKNSGTLGSSQACTVTKKLHKTECFLM